MNRAHNLRRRSVSRGRALDILRRVKVLIVEDDLQLARFLRRVLMEEGYTADISSSGADAIEQAKSGVYDLVLLDWMLPDLDGLAVVRELRRLSLVTPILMLTARGETKERVLGLKAGADDYLVKPFEVDELLARVHAQVRRTSDYTRLRIGDLELSRTGPSARIKGAALELSAREYDFLMYLAHHQGKPVPRAELLRHIWDTTTDPNSNLVDVMVSRLRDKLGPHAWMVDTVRGLGYCLRTEPAS